MSTEIQEYSAIDSALARFGELYRDKTFAVTTKDGMKEAKAARAVLRSERVSLEKSRQKLKAYHLEEGRKIDREAERITQELRELEDPIDKQIKDEEGRKAREEKERKEAEERAEAERVRAGEAQVEAIKARAFDAVGKSATELQALIKEVEALDTAGLIFPFPAQQAKDAVLEKLDAMWAAAVRADAERERLAAQRKEADEAMAKAEAERKAAAEEAARLVAERKKIEAQTERNRAIEEEANKLTAEINAERERLERLDAARKAEEKAEAAPPAPVASPTPPVPEPAPDARDPGERSCDVSLINEGREYLAHFLERFEDVGEFAVIVKAINEYLAESINAG